MEAHHRSSPALEPFARLPPECSLTLLTSTIGSSAGWLTAEWLGGICTSEPVGSIAIILVSWIRDLNTWKRDLRRNVNLQADTIVKDGRFEFVDCFTTLVGAEDGDNFLKHSEQKVTQAVTRMRSQKPQRKIILVLDCPDIVLALGLANATRLGQFTLALRTMVDSTILVLSADCTVLGPADTRANNATPLEANTRAFLVQQAHLARTVVSLRQLETGAARDVSGQLSITRGPGVYGSAEGDNAPLSSAEELEALFLVNRDGHTNVFTKGLR